MNQSVDIKDCWEELIGPLRHHEERKSLIQLAVFLLWQSWKSRNALIFKNQQIDVLETISTALRHWEDFGSNSNLQFWQPGPPDFVKFNFDASVDRSKSKGASAVIGRNSIGLPLVWRCKKFRHIVEPLVIEALACGEALLLAIDKGFQSVIIEGDCLVVIQSLHGQAIPLEIQGIIGDISELASRIPTISFVHVKGSGNKAAHSLASKTLKNPNFIYKQIHNLIFFMYFIYYFINI
ncbi:hypothetical protein P3X46_033661 [Hevea brasiliensis]|uniref:RNase H type-1 domain-containing protein n=1 Tax=Hevea brasiliensis TaxID=3981 RepID=A0ABQ9KDI6_HEVBR|nr:hypothetical protein P3X46_033661 [Hevea brasiliensis]